MRQVDSSTSQLSTGREEVIFINGDQRYPIEGLPTAKQMEAAACLIGQLTTTALALHTSTRDKENVADWVMGQFRNTVHLLRGGEQLNR